MPEDHSWLFSIGSLGNTPSNTVSKVSLICLILISGHGNLTRYFCRLWIRFRGGIHGLHWRLRPRDSHVAFPQPRMGQNQQRPLGGFEVAGNQKKQSWMMFKICSIVYKVFDVGKTMP